MKRFVLFFIVMVAANLSIAQNVTFPIDCQPGENQCACKCKLSIYSPVKTEYCVGEPITFLYMGSTCPSDYIDFGDGCASNYIYGQPGWSWTGGIGGEPNMTPIYLTYTYNNPGDYIVQGLWGNIATCSLNVKISPCDLVNNCIKSFAPTPGKYVVSFWVKEDHPPASLKNIVTYGSGIIITMMSTAGSTVATISANASTKIIDGWQKVEQEVIVPPGTTDIDILLQNNLTGSIDVYYDDIRFHPFNSSFKSYVYDPNTLRLMAELDERNYATMYEYDEEGALIRVKKETENGIKTIKENRNNVKKK